MNLLLIVVLPFLGALLPLSFGRTRTRCALAAAALPLLAFILLLTQAAAVFNDVPLRASWQWLPQLGLNIALRLDGLAFLFAALILGIGLLIILYARYYLAAEDSLPRLYALLLLFMGAMLGVVTADNLIMLLVYWELTGLISFLLIGYWSQQAAARRGARIALTVTGAGGLCLLAGILILGHIVGSFDLSTILAARTLIQQHTLYPYALILILIGAFTKSAQFPFQFWLPRAMAAPTPVSAYLHSATMVKLGIFLLARLYPVLAGSDWWFLLVTGTGLLTLLLGAYLALMQHDLKGLLAYSTISHLGLITLLFGLATPPAVVAALFHTINHAIFKASLFMAAGAIEHETGTRDMRRLKGLWRYLPHTAVLAMVAAAAMAGVPLFNGFLSKEMFFSETLTMHHLGIGGLIIPAVALLAGILAVAYSLRFIHDVFFNGEARELPIFPPHEPPRYMKIPLEILAVLCLAVGILPNFTVAPVLDAAVRATLGTSVPVYSLALWHGVNLPLLMSAIALLGGAILYTARHSLFAFHRYFFAPVGASAFATISKKINTASRAVLNFFWQASLSTQVACLIGAALFAIFNALDWSMETLLTIGGTAQRSVIDLSALLYLSIAICATIVAVYWHRQRLRAILALGVVGLMSALIFARFSAPDLALTQLAVEIVTVLLLLAALKFLAPIAPPEIIDSRPRYFARVTRDVLLAAGAGLAVAVLVYAAMTRPFDSIANYFIAHSVPGGGGHNVVNVILVDFRGFDTLGEISVLVIAAVAIAAALDGMREILPAPFKTASSIIDRPSDLLLSVSARLLLPLVLLLAAYLLARGHNAPGGGFVAGLVTSAILILQYAVQREPARRAHLQVVYVRVAGGGLLLALITGLGSWIFAAPFLTSTFAHWQIAALGDIELASAMIFDIGIYGAVVGATLLILSSLNRLPNTSATLSDSAT